MVLTDCLAAKNVSVSVKKGIKQCRVSYGGVRRSVVSTSGSVVYSRATLGVLIGT